MRGLPTAGPKNVTHVFAGGEQVVGDDPAMAAPPDRLCAHDGEPVRVAKLSQLGEVLGKGLPEGMVGVVLKTAHTP